VEWVVCELLLDTGLEFQNRNSFTRPVKPSGAE
jgi:hypothetical protein